MPIPTFNEFKKDTDSTLPSLERFQSDVTFVTQNNIPSFDEFQKNIDEKPQGNMLTRMFSGIAETVRDEFNEEDFKEGEIGDRAKNILTRVFSPLALIMPGVDYKQLRKELDEEAEGFSGGGNRLVPAMGEVIETAVQFAVAGELLKTANLIGHVPKSAGPLSKAFETGKVFMTQDILDSSINKDIKEGSPVISAMTSLSFGMVLSLGGQGFKGTWNALKPTEQKAALKMLGLDKNATKDQIHKAARNISKKYHPDKSEGMRKQFEEVINARDALVKERFEGFIPHANTNITKSDVSMLAKNPAARPDINLIKSNIYDKIALTDINRVKLDASNGVALAKNALKKFEEARKFTKKFMNDTKTSVHHVARDQKIGEIQYRQMAKDVTGKSSTKDMTVGEMKTFEKAMMKTDPVKNTMINSRIIKATDTETPIISENADIQNAHKGILKEREKNIRKVTAKVIKENKVHKRYNYFNWYKPTRNAFGQFEQDTGLPVDKLASDINVNSSKAAKSAEIEMAKVLFDIPPNAQLNSKEVYALDRKLKTAMSDLTQEENDRIAKYLFSADTRAEVLPLTSNEQGIAGKFEQMYQGPMAVERMEESLRFWMDNKKAPADVKKFTKEQIKVILEGGKIAREQKQLPQYVRGLFAKGTRFGIRQFYYHSESTETNIINDYMQNTSGTGLEGVSSTDAETPALIGQETLARKGKPNIKPGSIFTNAMQSYQRVKVRNAVAGDLKELYSRLNQVDLSESDKLYLDDLYSEVLMKGEILRKPFTTFTKLSGSWWRARLTLFNTEVALGMAMRNSLQTLAEGGQVVNLKHFAKNMSRVALAAPTGRPVDAMMEEDFNNNFASSVSQKRSISKDAMFLDLAEKVKSKQITARTADMLKLVLDKTGGLYVGVDEISRVMAWKGTYLTVKEASTAYLNGSISMNKFMDITSIDTMMNTSQTETALDYLSKGDVRGLSNYMAHINTLDLHRGYKIPERAGVERKTSSRIFTGIYTYVRGKYDLYANRGVKPLISGIKDGDFGKAKRSANNIAKGIVGSWAADKILLALGVPVAYNIFKAGYNILQPAAGKVKDFGERVGMIQYQYTQGNMSKADALKAVVDSMFDLALEFVPIPTKKLKTKLRNLGKDDPSAGRKQKKEQKEAKEKKERR